MSSLREVDHVDEEGRKWRVMIPVDAPDSQVALGIPIGPPGLGPLGLPLAFEVRLHNALFDRGLFTSRHVRRSSQGIQSALRSALRLDVQRITSLYTEKEVR